MSDRAASPVQNPASADAPAARPDDAVVGEVSEEKVELKNSEGVPAAETKGESAINESKSKLQYICAATTFCL